MKKEKNNTTVRLGECAVAYQKEAKQTIRKHTKSELVDLFLIEREINQELLAMCDTIDAKFARLQETLKWWKIVSISITAIVALALIKYFWVVITI